MKFRIMDMTGHSEIDFGESKADIDRAMEKFAELVGKGHAPASRKNGESDYTVNRSFDPTADETLFVPAMQGG